MPEGTITRVDPEAGTRVARDYPVKVWVSTGRSIVTIPVVTNMAEEAAIQTLKDAGLDYGQTRTDYSPSVAAGIVMGTSPDGGTSVRQGTTIDLLISNGLVVVPKVTGLAVSDANRQLSPLGLNISVVPEPSCSGGTVTSQSLAPGDQPQKSAITLRYCSGA